MKKTTIKDIAKESGFSICTVSHALNYTATVNKFTREKIIKIAAKYNYKPSYMAKAIKTRKSRNIALILQHISPNSKNLEIFEEVEKKLYEYGYCLTFFNTRSDLKKQKEIIEIVKDRIIDGVILQDSGFYKDIMEKEVISELNKMNIPLFIIEKKIENNNVPYANIDNYKGGQIAAKYLLKLNHSNIGILTLSRKYHVFNERINGFINILKANNLNPGFIFELENRTDFDYINEQLKNIHTLIIEKKVSAIFCTMDLLAAYLMKLLKMENIKIPEDISIISFDNDPLSNILSPSLTTINNDLKKLGETAVDNIISKIENNRILKSVTIIDPYIIERESTAKLS